MAAYRRDSDLEIKTALTGISSDRLQIKNGEGLFYWPDLGINAIDRMVPGQRY